MRASVRVGGVRWWLRTGETPERVAPLLAEALEALASGHPHNLKSGRRKQLYPLRLGPHPGAEHLLKVNVYAGFHAWRRGLLGLVGAGSKARRELEVAEAAALRGIATPIPLAAGERRERGRMACCYLLTPLLPEVADLRQLWQDRQLPPAARRTVASAFGALARQAHDAGIRQDDFAPNNFLVRRDDASRLYMIDFERARVRRGSSRAARRFMLAKVDREVGARAGAVARWRFLVAYAGGDRAAARQWWRRVESATPRLARRDCERRARHAVSEGRRLEEEGEAGGWRGWLHADPLKPRLLAALDRSLRERPARRAPEARALPDAWCVVGPPVDSEEGARIWATARTLHERGLSPAPRAWLQRADAAVLVWERGSSRRFGEGLDTAREHAAVRVLFDRLLSLGEWRGTLASAAVALETSREGAPRALLLAPHALRLGGRAEPDRRRRVRALVRGLGAP